MSLVSLETERSIIGACMLDNRLIERLRDRLRSADFSDDSHRAVWSILGRLSAAGTACDAVTVAEAVQDQGVMQAGALSWLADMSRDTPAVSNAESYAAILADLSARRRMLGELTNIEQLARDTGTEFSSVVDSAQGRMAGLIRADSQTVQPVGEYLTTDLLDELDRKWSGEQSAMGAGFGLGDLDARTMGMHPGQMVVVGARPSMGKTAFALNTIRQTCLSEGRPTVMFSLEMDRRSIITRLTSALGNVPINALRDPKQHMNEEYFSRLTAPVQNLRDAPLVIDDRSALTPSQIRGACKRWRDHYGSLGLVVVDYLGLVRADGKHGNREQEVAEVSRAMKGLAKEMGCPVLVLSQLNRGLENRPNKRPIMSDLRESGALEQDADVILFLYRDEVYNKDSPDNKGIGEVIIGKQREGELGTVYVATRLDRARMDQLDLEAAAAARQPQQPAARRPARSAMDMMED